jgi:Carbohydrate esterase, sialic acid-specific acetylesterase
MGQSNAAGMALTSQASSTISFLADAGWPFSFWKTGGSSWNSGSGITTEQDGHFGPELGLSYGLVVNNQTGFYIYKYAIGGTTLALEWGSRGTGGLYDKAMSGLKQAEASICASGKKPVVEAVFWMQGESDAEYLPLADLYQGNLNRLVTQSRQDFLGPKNPFIIGLIDGATGVWTYGSIVRAAEKSVGSEPGNGYVDTDKMQVYPGSACTEGYCEIHYDAKGQLSLGQAFYAKYESMVSQ